MPSTTFLETPGVAGEVQKHPNAIQTRSRRDVAVFVIALGVLLATVGGTVTLVGFVIALRDPSLLVAVVLLFPLACMALYFMFVGV
ncbi:MAG: hypothetical protein GY724_04985 [Actinomycetia bacterium]|nr:hypothetical protein [Actinomycetes bacterium]MCP4227260.1 hypothetical protein [Actinomycetes bacterium]